MSAFLFAAAVSSEAVTPGTAVSQPLLPHTQAALLTTTTATPVTQVQLHFSPSSLPPVNLQLECLGLFKVFSLSTGGDSGETTTSSSQSACHTRH